MYVCIMATKVSHIVITRLSSILSNNYFYTKEKALVFSTWLKWEYNPMREKHLKTHLNNDWTYTTY